MDYGQINNDYNFHFLANNVVYELEFLEGEINERFSGEKRRNNENLLVYPNPSSGKINISSEIDFKSVSIITLEGKLMYEEYYTTNINSLFNISLNKGLYLVKVELINGETITKKVVILD